MRRASIVLFLCLCLAPPAGAEKAVDRIENSFFDRAVTACGSTYDRARKALDESADPARSAAQKRLAACMSRVAACFYFGTVPDAPELDQTWQCRTRREPDNDRAIARAAAAATVCRDQALRSSDKGEQDRRFAMCWAGFRGNLDIRFDWREAPKPSS
jgi:hypothetical protein